MLALRRAWNMQKISAHPHKVCMARPVDLIDKNVMKIGPIFRLTGKQQVPKVAKLSWSLASTVNGS